MVGSRFAAVVVLLVLTAPALAAAEEPPTAASADLSELAWMAGHWLAEPEGNRLEEVWLDPAGGTMVGVSRSVVDGATVAFEYLRIELQDGGLVYLASPGGRQPPTVFRLVEHGRLRATFANPQHDFPQRIVYWRDGEVLRARVEGTVDGQTRTSEWRWTLHEGGAR